MLLDFHSEIFSWIRGGLFTLFVYHLSIYYQNRSKLYLYYSLYLFGLTIFFLKDVLPGNLAFYEYLDYPIQFLAYASYLSFGRELLDTRHNVLKWDRNFEIATKILLALAPIFIVVQVLFGYEFQTKMFMVIAPMLSLFTMVGMVVVYTRIDDIMTKYFVYATLLFLILANVSFSEIIIGSEPFINEGVQPTFFMYLGAIWQSLIISVIIGSIIKRIEQKSKNAEVRLAVKLKEMEELKMTALQSQMNPHFLFNSLNSINNFVLKNDVENASDYITKFSKLIRVILNSSSSPTSTLSEELSILKLYVKLEQMRIAGGFKYKVEVGDDIPVDQIKVPPLFLQPYIENAIWHGITKKEGDKLIKLTITRDDNIIKFQIFDNGIGIDKNKENKHMSHKRKFFGARATEDRIKILYQDKHVKVHTEDVSKGDVTGTVVTVSFEIE